jgi:transcriptional regulator with XRE-family HTH domain
MFEQLGKIIREAREQLGMEQGDVAARIGIGQQAVSTWERGMSRPRRTMLRSVAQELLLDEEVLLEAGGYRAGSERGVRPPARPLARSLPIDELPPERFEDLVTALMQALHPEGHATRFGGPGEKQFGIDVLIGGDRGNAATGQCKRHQQFGPAAVKDAVGEVTIAAHTHYLFLSRLTATPGARKEIAKHPGWQLWDGEDISRFIRTKLPPDQAIRLVDTYFPGHRQAFLGFPQAAPWLPPEEFFFQARRQIYTHDWALVGRADEVARLAAVLYGSTGTLAALVGRGGVGKTRLLRAVAEAAHDRAIQVRILPSGVPVEAVGFELLPRAGSLVVLIDDVHERDDIAYLVAGIWRHNAAANVLVATRPYGWDRLRTDLARAALLPDELVSVELGDLKASDAEALAREALGETHEAIVQRLANLTLDCPLATVVGGVLIRRGQLDPAQLEHDEEVRDAIMRGFRDALVSDPVVVDPYTRGAVLDAIAALQPFRTNEQGFKDALGALAGEPFDILNKHLRSLEDAGILRRRDASLRIMPDLLGDVILAQVCYDEQANADTGYLDRVRGVADGQVLQHLFVNVSRVDWQVRRRNASSPSLVETLWKPLEEEIRQADIGGRDQLVKLLSRVAYFQPERVLAIARWLIENPTDQLSEDDAPWSFLHRPTYQDVINALPAVLKGAAYTFELLPAALDVLWDLAQTDTRPRNQFPDHPMRVLTDLAEFEVGKPPAYNEAIVDAASRWFADGQIVSPFDVLEPLLATEGSRQTYQDFTIAFQPFPLNADAVGPVRQRVIDLALEEARSPDVRRAVAGVHALEAALRYPSGMYGRPVTDEERDRWTPGIVETIRRLGDVADKLGVDPAVIVAIRQTLNWHSSYSKTATRPVAESIVDALPDDLENRVALIIRDGWGHLLRDRWDDFEVAQRKVERRLADTIAALCERTDEDIMSLVNDRLSVEQVAFGPTAGHPGPLLAGLVKARTSLAPLLIALIVSGEAAGLEPLLPVVLATYAELDATAALDRARKLLEMQPADARIRTPWRSVHTAWRIFASHGEPEGLSVADLKRGVAQALGSNRGMRPLAGGEMELLLIFAADSDAAVRQAAAVAAQRIAKEQPTEACQLVAAIDFSDSPHLADEVFTCFSPQHYGLSWEYLTDAQVTLIRRRLVFLPELDQYWISSLLADRSAIDPQWVIELLQDRVTHAEGLDALSGYHAMPFNWDNRLRVHEHADFVSHLRQLHAWIADAPHSWVRREIGAEIFQEVAGNYDQSVLAILTEALASTNEADVRAVAAILRKAHRTLIWDAPVVVSTSLRAAARFGDECRQEMAGALWAATITGARIGTPGQPFKEDVEQRDRSTAVADALPKGSFEEEFYRNMASSAEQSIARSVAEDRTDDGRDW